MQTAGEALNYHPHLHGLLAQLHKRELITDDDAAQILSQDHTGFGVPVLRSLGEGGQVSFIQDEHSIKDIMKSQGIPDFFIRRSLGVVGQAPPPIPKFIDTALAMVRQAHHTAGYVSLSNGR